METPAATLKSKAISWYEKYMAVVGVLGQLVFYLQGFKIFSTHEAKDVSLAGFCCGFISVLSWLVYGIIIKNDILIMSNLVAVVGAIFVLVGIMMYGFF